jgi:PadR family transcriptional regulator PadR
VTGIERVTDATLDVLEVLLQAHRDGRDVHGWEVKKATQRSGPTVYGVIDRLEDASFVEGHWQYQDSSDKGPRRRYYRLTGTGIAAATKLAAEPRQRSRVKFQTLKRGLVIDSGWPR